MMTATPTRKTPSNTIGLKLATLAFALALGATAIPASAAEPKSPAEQEAALAPYTGFLKGQHQSAADYILSLFEKYDVVVLCERAHPEVTQYELILDVVRDQRFVRKVGHVFTEIGSSSLSNRVDALLLEGKRSDSELKARMQEIFLDMGFSFPWEKSNYYDFLRRVYEFNSGLPAENRVRVHPSGMPFVWEGMTAEKAKEFRKTLRDRDRVIADQIIEKMKAISADGKAGAKALVIMNFRHALPHIEMKRRERTKVIKNVAGYLMEARPGWVANVMLNTIRVLPNSSDEQLAITALCDGKWDAAFASLGNPSLGFAFAGSPFGADKFDFWPVPTGTCYADRFTGFVFWKPLAEHRMQRGVDGLLDDAGVKLAAQRLALLDGGSAESAMGKIKTLQQQTTTDYGDRSTFKSSDIEERIGQWLKAGTAAQK